MRILAIITGIITAILGIYGLTVPFRVFLGLGWLVGALFTVNGIESIVGGFSNKVKKDVWLCVLGVIETIFGILLLCNAGARFLSDVMIANFAGIAVIFYGAGLLARGFHIYKASKGMAILSIICGVLAILAGIFSLSHPILTMISVSYLICVNVLMQGINMVVLACSYKKA